MSKIVINKTESAIYADNKLLIPGTNVLESINDEDGAVKAFIKNGDIVVKEPEKMTDADKKEAVENVTTREAVKGLKKSVKGINTESAEQKLDKFEEQLKKGA